MLMCCNTANTHISIQIMWEFCNTAGGYEGKTYPCQFSTWEFKGFIIVVMSDILTICLIVSFFTIQDMCNIKYYRIGEASPCVSWGFFNIITFCVLAIILIKTLCHSNLRLLSPLVCMQVLVIEILLHFQILHYLKTQEG